MNITPINNSQTNFSGRIITKGKWTPDLKKAFLENEEVAKLASGEHNIIGRMSRKKAGQDLHHAPSQIVYRLELEALNENASIFNRIKSFLGLGKTVKVSNGFHTDLGTECIIEDRINAKKMAERLEINI